MRPEQNRRGVGVSPLTAAEHVTDLVDPHRQPYVPHRPAKPVTHLSVGRSERDAVESAVVGPADLRLGTHRFDEALPVDREPERHITPYRRNPHKWLRLRL
jgi:hypothetical protein